MDQLNDYDSNRNRLTPIQEGSSWMSGAVVSLPDQEGITLLKAPQGASIPSSEPGKSEPADLDALRSALDAIPQDVSVDTWTRLVAAVKDGAPDVETAETLLKEWSPENREGEYAHELEERSEEGITVSVVLGIAKQHGWHPPETQNDETSGEIDRVSDSFTLADFEAILNSLESDSERREVEALAFDLVEEASNLSNTELEKALLILEKSGARARKCSSWKTEVRRQKKERNRRLAEAKKMNRGPTDLKGGELTAWIEEHILESDAFAVDDGGELFYYVDGHYRRGGEKHLSQRVKKLLYREGAKGKFTEYRCREVLYSITTDAPCLWKKPPVNRICLQNGILNLDTGEVAPHSPDQWLMTRSLKVRYDPTAKGDAWRDFLDSIMPEDVGAEIGFEIIAYLIRRAQDRRKAVFLYGGPNTGKSTFLDNLVYGIFGKANTTNMSLQKLENSSFARANLFGRRLNVCADLPSKPLKGMSVFKRIAGGDRMHCERKHEQGFDFKPYCHLVFSGNGPIIAPSAGEAFWDRWIVVPFFNKFGRESGNHIPKEELDDKLRDPEELSALLNEILPIIREGRGITQTPSMKRSLNWIRRVNEGEEEGAEVPTDFPPYSGDGGVQEGGEPSLD